MKIKRAELIYKRGLFSLLTFGIFSLFMSCKHDEEDWDDVIIDYSPVVFEILVVDSSGENLLEESTAGNILGSEMYIELSGEKYDVEYGRPMDPVFPYPNLTRAYMPEWYGAFIAPYWYPYPELPERTNRLYIGEFPGNASKEIKFLLFLDGNSYEISFINKKINGLDIDRHYYLDGQEIPSSSFTITL